MFCQNPGQAWSLEKVHPIAALFRDQATPPKLVFATGNQGRCPGHRQNANLHRTHQYMTSSRFETFEELMNKSPLVLVVDCIRFHVSKLPVEMACDHIDRCYAEALNPDSTYFIRCRQAWRLFLESIDYSPLSAEQAEVFAYFRAFPLLESVPEEDTFENDFDYQAHRNAVADQERAENCPQLPLIN